MERFFVEPGAIAGNEAKITGDELKHLRSVLRMKTGDQIEVFDGAGKGFYGRVAQMDKAVASVKLEAPVTETRDSPLRVCLAQGIPKGEKMEWIVQKATELGVASLQPLELSRCIVRLEDDKKRRDRQARWQKVAKEAARQCGRLHVPEIWFPTDLHSFLRRVSPADKLLIPWEEGGLPLHSVFAGEKGRVAGGADGDEANGADSADKDARILMMIGPEGGMTAEEVEAGRRAGGTTLTLGPRLLRTETAGLALLSILQHHWGDMG